MLPALIALLVAASLPTADSAVASPREILAGTNGAYCLASGLCPPGPAPEREPAGLMFVAIGLIATGVALRRTPRSGSLPAE